jgi:3-oxoacyl-[acyl-carrier-protein] synthase-3
MRFARTQIDSIGYKLPPEVVSTRELEGRLTEAYQSLRISMGQLEHISGIRERRFWPTGYTVTEGATAAAIDALAKGQVASDELGVLLYVGVCREHFEPATACHVAGSLKESGYELADDLIIHDVSDACLGVITGMLEISNRIELGQIRAGMVVTCESARDIVDIAIKRLQSDPSIAQLTQCIATLTGGSGAVAVLLTDGSFGPGHELVSATTRSAPEHHNLCRWGVSPSKGGDPTRTEFMTTDPLGVLSHGITLGQKTWRAFLAEVEWTGEMIDRSVCHQVGSKHREAILQSLELSPDNDFASFEYLGNTGTAALIGALALADQRGFIAKGHRVALLAIGSGLNCTMIGVNW